MVALNIALVLFGALWTAAVGVPVLLIVYTTYPIALLCRAAGRPELADRIVELNATVTAMVAQKLWASAILKVCGITVRTRESVAIDWQRSHVICSNHASIFDILALAYAIPPPFRFVAKRELLRWPVIGWALKPSGQIVVDRADHGASVRQLELEAGRGVHGQVIFFVEGTRSRTGELMPFKKGAFHFAVDRRLPAVPTAIYGSFAVLGRTAWWRLHPGRDIEIRFAEPIEPPPEAQGKAAAIELLEATRAAMVRALEA